MIKIKLVEIFYLVDEFCKESEQYLERKSLPTDGKARRNRKPRMSDSEVMTILIYFHLSGARELKGFYLGYIRNHCIQEFPKQLSYNRFVERKRSVGVLLMLLLNLRCLGTCTGISFIDSTPIRACHDRRAARPKRSKSEQPMVAQVWVGSMASSYT